MNVFLVTSPFQYLCANEARAYFSSTPNCLLVEFGDTEVGIRQLQSLIDSNQWDTVITIPARNRTFQTPKVIKAIHKLCERYSSSVDTFYFGEYNGWRTKVLMRNLDFQRYIYFDDGTLTLNEYNQLIVPKKEFYRPRWLQDTLLRLQGCQPVGLLPYSDKLEVFSLFDLPMSDALVHRNEFTQLRQSLNLKRLYSPKAPLGFIGQGCIGEPGHKKLSDYLSDIQTIAKNAEYGVIYFPHRNESEQVTTHVKAIPNLHYHRSQAPLELELYQQNIRLSRLVGLFSTAMYTLSIIYKEIPIKNLDNDVSTH